MGHNRHSKMINDPLQKKTPAVLLILFLIYEKLQHDQIHIIISHQNDIKLSTITIDTHLMLYDLLLFYFGCSYFH
jgi:hypothetical protein